MTRFSMTSPNALDCGGFPPPPRSSTTSEAASFPASARPDVPKSQGEHPSDLTITYAQRLALERVSQGFQLGDLATDEVVGPLLDADLVTETVRDGRLVGWGLTELGEVVLEANRARLPEGWRMDGLLGGSLSMRHYVYAGRLGNVSLAVSDADPREHLETSLELSEARVALYRHLLSQTKGGAR